MRCLVHALILLNSSIAIGAPMVQTASSTPSATLPKLDTNEPYEIATCADHSGDISGGFGGGGPAVLMGRVRSSTTVEVPYFDCRRKIYGWSARWRKWTGYGGPCENHTHTIPSPIWGNYCAVEPWFTITLLFANPADASKMPLGKAVRLKGDPFIISQNKADFLFMNNVKVLYADPFGR